MRNNYLFLIFIYIIAFLEAQKPENIQILEINENSNKNGKYEITVSKDEIFGLQFERSRGSNCYWGHSNETFLKESNYVRFLNSSTWDYLNEEYEKELEKAKNSEEAYHSDNMPYPVNMPQPIVGGSEYYYEVFKALDGGNQIHSLYFTYTCGEDVIAQNATVDIFICDENNKNTNEKCANKINSCTNSLNEEECALAEATDPKTSKCVYDKAEKVCKEEKKLCYEIEDGATKDICSSAQVSETNKECVFVKQILAMKF